MKYIRTFENIEKEFKNGDYVIAYNFFTNKHLSHSEAFELKKFLESNVGIIKYSNINVNTRCDVEYINVPEDIKDILDNYGIFYDKNTIAILKTMLRHATEQEIEQYEIEKDSNKYNL